MRLRTQFFRVELLTRLSKATEIIGQKPVLTIVNWKSDPFRRDTASHTDRTRGRERRRERIREGGENKGGWRIGRLQ